MGAAPSRELANKILALSDTAVHNGQSSIELDENLTQELLTLWKTIPQSKRNEITGKKKTTKTAGEPAGESASQQTRQVRPTHSNLEPISSSAEEEATKLLRTDLCFDHWARVNGTCEEVMKARVSLTIRERFIKVAMGKLLDTYKKQKDGPKDAASLFFPGMKKDAKEWANEGRKLESLCKGLYPKICSNDAIEDHHLGLLYVLPFNTPKEFFRALSLKDGKRRTGCIESFKKALFDRGIGEQQLKPYAAMATSLFSECRAYLDPGAVKLSAQKHVFARDSLPSHSGSNCEETNSRLHYGNRNQLIGRTPQAHDVSQQSRQGYAPMVNSVNAQASSECGTISPSAEINDYERFEFDLSASPGSTVFQNTSDPARSSVSDFPENRSQVSILDHGDTPTTNPNSADGTSLDGSSISAEPVECSPVSLVEQTQQTEQILGQSPLTIESARINQKKRKRTQIDHGDSKNDAQVSQKIRSFDVVRREQNNHFSNVAMQAEPTATESPDVIGESQISTNTINSEYDLGGGSQLNSAEWLQPSFVINGSSLSESAPILPLLDSTTSDQTNNPTDDFHNGLYTLFDHHRISVAPPNPMLWNLFPPEDQHSHSVCHDFPM